MRMANLLVMASAVMLVWACAASAPPKDLASPVVTTSAAANGNDCAVMAAVAKKVYGATRDDPPVRVTLDGDETYARWMAEPECEWAGLGVNYVYDGGPTTPPDLMSMAHVSFHKPRYDGRGATIRTRITPPGEPPSKNDPVHDCRVRSGVAGWTATECKAR